MTRRVLALFSPYRGRLAAVLVLIVASAGLGMVPPFLLRDLLDVAIPRDDDTLLAWLVAGMIGIAVVTGAIGVGQTWLSNVVGQRVMHDLRAEVYRHLQRLSLAFFTRTRTGEVQSRIANDIGGVQSVVTNTATSIASNLTTVIATVIAMLLLDWRLALFSLALTPFFVLLARRVGRQRKAIASHRQGAMSDIASLVQESLSVSGILLSKTMGRGADLAADFERESARLADLEVSSRMAGRWVMASIQTSFAVMPALVYLFAGLNGGAVSIGTLVAFTTLQTRVFFPIQSLLNVGVEIQTSSALFARVFEYLDLPVEIHEGRRELASVRGEVAMHDVWFRYDVPGAVPVASSDAADRADHAHPVTERSTAEIAANGSSPAPAVTDGGPGPADSGSGTAAAVDAVGDDPLGVSDEVLPERWTLQGVDLLIEPGTRTAIVGETGSGKTTLGYLAARLYDPERGTVTIDGVDLRELTFASLSDAVGVVSQETYLLHASVRENLRFASRDATDEELEAAARAARIHDSIVALPDGYDTVVGERGFRFSGGEKQRIAIARTILRNPPVLILDEATSALDVQTERAVDEALGRLAEGRTVLVIAHRLSTVRSADQIVVLDAGRVVERGTHEELLQQGGRYAAMVERDFAPVPA